METRTYFKIMAALLALTLADGRFGWADEGDDSDTDASCPGPGDDSANNDPGSPSLPDPTLQTGMKAADDARIEWVIEQAKDKPDGFLGEVTLEASRGTAGTPITDQTSSAFIASISIHAESPETKTTVDFYTRWNPDSGKFEDVGSVIHYPDGSSHQFNSAGTEVSCWGSQACDDKKPQEGTI